MTNPILQRLTLMSLPVTALAVTGALGSPTPAFADPLPYGPDTCIQGYVWREANSNDHVCVTNAVRSQTAQENQLAAQRRSPNGGEYGPDTCAQGYVWREAFEGDHVCVTPNSRTQAANDNAAAASRMSVNKPSQPPSSPSKPPWCALPDPAGISPGC
ncbi:MAG TPA: hypothetical protein VFB19_09475 [Mycobacterium sp.]|nr:hypothetical protein [Mycobacterium sp.]